MAISIKSHKSEESDFWHYPRIAPGSFIDSDCGIHGNVWMDPALLFDNVTIRGESCTAGGTYISRNIREIKVDSPLDQPAAVVIGKRVIFGDGCSVHNESVYDKRTIIEQDVLLGHEVIIHGSHIGKGAILFLGVRTLDESHVQPYAVVAGGAVVAERRPALGGQITHGIGKHGGVLREAEQASYDRGLGVTREESRAASQKVVQINLDFTEREIEHINLAKLNYSLYAALEISREKGSSNIKDCEEAIDKLHQLYRIGNYGDMGVAAEKIPDSPTRTDLCERLDELFAKIQEALVKTMKEGSVSIVESTVRADQISGRGAPYTYDPLDLSNIMNFVRISTGHLAELGKVSEWNEESKIQGPWAYHGVSHLTSKPKNPPIYDIRYENNLLTESPIAERIKSAPNSALVFLSKQRPALEAFGILAADKYSELRDVLCFLSTTDLLETSIPEGIEASIKKFPEMLVAMSVDPEIAEKFPELVEERFNANRISHESDSVGLVKDPQKATELILEAFDMHFPSPELARGGLRSLGK